MNTRSIIYYILIALFLAPVFAEEVIINSKDWTDVYSGMLYGYLIDKQPNFLTSEKHSAIILNEVPKTEKVEIYSSKQRPFVVGYESMLKSQGYDATEKISSTMSLEFANKLENIKNFIIVDSSYGYNAIAVAPYAVVSSSYVLFVDRYNIGQVTNFLDDRNPEKIIVYGNVDREVLDELDKYSPEIINEDGDRFANNVEIVKKYKEIKDAKQVILTNGEFIESEIMSGNEPVLFIGVQNVPEKIKDYIKSSNIEVGVLIGNELVGTATTVRRQTGISTFVKFARSARQPEGTIAQIEGLDLFRVPVYPLNLTIESVKYNALTKQLEITLKNNAEIITYFKGTYTVSYDGKEQTVGDIDPIFIDSESTKTMVYEIDPVPSDADATVNGFVIFGESKNSLERIIQFSFPLETIEVMDDTAITIEQLLYDKSKNRFLVKIKNIGEVDTFVDTEVVDLLIMNTAQTFGSEKIIKLKPGQSGYSTISAELVDEDLKNNPEIKVRAYYGQRENALVKVVEAKMIVEIKSMNIWTYLPLTIIIILLILIIIKKRKKKQHHV